MTQSKLNFFNKDLEKMPPSKNTFHFGVFFLSDTKYAECSFEYVQKLIINIPQKQFCRDVVRFCKEIPKAASVNRTTVNTSPASTLTNHVIHPS